MRSFVKKLLGNSVLRTKVKAIFSDKYLLYTNTGISIGLSISGDVMQQTYQRRKKPNISWNTKRSMHMAASGLVVGPLCHYWYLYLDRWLPGRSLRVVIKKLAMDQLICSPLYIASFLWTTCLLENKSWKDFKKECTGKGWRLYFAEWVVWTPAQFVNFCFLPPKFRVLYDNFISLGVDCYYSYVKYES